MHTVIAETPVIGAAASCHVAIDEHSFHAVRHCTREGPGAEDLKPLLERICESDPESLDLAMGGLGAWAAVIWDSISGLGEDFFTQIGQVFVSISRPHELPRDRNSSKRTQDYELAIAFVASHAILQRIDELITDVSQQLEMYRALNADSPDLYPCRITYGAPRGLLGALMSAALQVQSEEMLQALVCREAAARLRVSHHDPELVRQFHRHIHIFKALGLEAHRLSLEEELFDLGLI